MQRPCAARATRFVPRPTARTPDGTRAPEQQQENKTSGAQRTQVRCEQVGNEATQKQTETCRLAPAAPTHRSSLPDAVSSVLRLQILLTPRHRERTKSDGDKRRERMGAWQAAICGWLRNVSAAACRKEKIKTHHLRIPVRIEVDDRVGSLEVDAQSTCTRADLKDE